MKNERDALFRLETRFIGIKQLLIKLHSLVWVRVEVLELNIDKQVNKPRTWSIMSGLQ